MIADRSCQVKLRIEGRVQRVWFRGWTVREEWTIEVQNSKEIPVVVDVRRNFSGDWILATEAAYEKVDANKVKFVLPLKPGEKKTVPYKLTTRHGLNVTK